MQRLTRRAVIWYARHEFPRYGHVLNRWGINRQADWARAPVVETRERFHGLWMRLDTADFFQRIAYFLGSYHEMDVLAALDMGMRPGDAFIDAGANIGLVSLHASGRVGPGGIVHAFEPNPDAVRRLRWHIARNLLTNIRCYEGGLSDSSERLELRVPGEGNLAAGTLGPIPRRYAGLVSQAASVVTAAGDDVIEADDPRPLFIKLDVEGFEQRAITGLREVISGRLPAILTEVNGEMLEMNSASPRGIFDTLAPLGYRLFAIDRRGFRKRHSLAVHPLTREQIDLEKDVLFLHPDGPHWSRFEPAMMQPGRYWRHLCPASL
ncbi:MAG: FkbM family methyltransferase [Phycisphaerales bacterium]|nr:FkbM family methyltransferase [Phycisphaerales bacterium]